MVAKAKMAKVGDADEAQLSSFVDKYSPDVAELFRASRKKMQALVPGAVELVYDNYNALVIGYGPSDRASDAPLSIAAYPKWVNLFFLQGAVLPDPKKVLKGSGKIVRNITMRSAGELDRPEVRALINAALKECDPPIDPKQPGRLVIKSVSAKQRPRRPRAD